MDVDEKTPPTTVWGVLVSEFMKQIIEDAKRARDQQRLKAESDRSQKATMERIRDKSGHW